MILSCQILTRESKLCIKNRSLLLGINSDEQTLNWCSFWFSVNSFKICFQFFYHRQMLRTSLRRKSKPYCERVWIVLVSYSSYQLLLSHFKYFHLWSEISEANFVWFFLLAVPGMFASKMIYFQIFTKKKVQ